jgi:hypothetical protein
MGASPWVPAVTAVVIGLLGYALFLRPASARVGQLAVEVQRERARLEQAQGRLQAALRVPRVPLPVSPAELQARWPAVLRAAASHGMTVDLISLTPTAVQAGSVPRVSAAEITVRLAGPYLGLDDTLSEIASLFPLWAWKTLEIAGSPGKDEVRVTATAVVVLSSPPASPPRSLPRPPSPPGPGQPSVPGVSVEGGGGVR